MLLTASRDSLAPSGQSANSQYRAPDFPLDGNCRSKRQARRFSYSISDETIQPYLQNFRRETVIHGLHLNNEFALSVVQHLEAKYYGQSGPGRIFPLFGSPDTVHTQLVANRAKPYTQILRRSSSSPTASTLPDQDYHKGTYLPHSSTESVSSIHTAVPTLQSLLAMDAV